MKSNLELETTKHKKKKKKNLRTGQEKNSWKELYTKWAVERARLHMLERVKEVGSWSIKLELMGTSARGKTACRDHQPQHAPKLCKHSGNRRENQEQIKGFF